MGADRPHDVPGFEKLLEPYLDRLYRLAFRFTGQVSDAEDLVQDVLVKLYQRRDELTSIEELGPWLSRVLYNHFVDQQRKFARKRLSLVGGVGPGDGAPEDVLGNLESTDAGPDVAADRAVDITRLSEALATLSLEQRAVLLMHDAEGYKLQEIQRITGVPLGTLKSRLHRARARVREVLEQMEPFSAEQRVSGGERN